MRNLLALTAALVISAPACAAQTPTGGVDMATARKIERIVQLPGGSKPLGHYARFYFKDQYTPAGMVSGWYVNADDPPFDTWPHAGVHLEKPNVSMDDGGCYAISLTYDPARDVVTDIHCNGYA
jgi:hypothetical protein